MTALNTIRCVGCEGGVPPLTSDEIQTYLKEVRGWEVSADQKSLIKKFTFKGFFKTMAFVNAVAWVANQEGHHPDMAVGFNYCHITFTTHAIDGLTKNDFICAAKIDTIEQL